MELTIFLIRMSKSLSLPQQAHNLLKPFIHNGDSVVDATCGNGHDSLFLAEQVAPSGLVYSFDIQQIAIIATRRRIQQAGLKGNLNLIYAGHENMQAYITNKDKGNIKAVMFNLGYLPYSNKQVITSSDTTLSALNTAVSLLAPTAIITILAYPGHQGGSEETLQVKNWCQQLSTNFSVKIIHSSRPTAKAPQLFVVQPI